MVHAICKTNVSSYGARSDPGVAEEAGLQSEVAATARGVQRASIGPLLDARI